MSSSAPSARPFADLTGRLALVTGAGRGIGAGIVESLSAAGAMVAVNAFTEASATRRAETVAARTGGRVVAVPGDATTPEGVRAIVDTAVAELGGLDICVNAVGDAIMGPLADLPGGSPAPDDAEIARILDLNLVSAIWTSRIVAPVLAARGGGVLVHVAGAAAVRGGAQLAVYAAGKSGIVGLTRALALEWAPANIRVNAISPGIVPDPEIPDFFTAEQAATYVTGIPAGRFGHPDEFGDLVRYLVSDEARYLTGQAITLDGGLTL